MGPASLFSERFRHRVREKFSTAGMKFEFHRPYSNNKTENLRWRLQEFTSFVFCFSVGIGVVLGYLPPAILVAWYIIEVGLMQINAIRGMAAHRYDLSNERGNTGLRAQFDDSINIAGRSISTWFLCPNGMQYHALHHLFPGIPYHSLDAAHRRLMDRLPSSSIYHDVNVDSVWVALGGLIKAQLRGHKSALKPISIGSGVASKHLDALPHRLWPTA